MSDRFNAAGALGNQAPLVILSPVVVEPLPDRCLSFSDLASVMASTVQPAGFLLQSWTQADAGVLLADIRRSPFWDRPVFLDREDARDPLSDGVATPEEAWRAAGQMAGIRQSLKLDPGALLSDERLLYYLYLRDQSELTPVCDRQAKLLYRYPLAEVLCGGDEKEVSEWLASMTRHRLLEPATLLDRTRHCRQCGGAHLHFLDVCPHCRSIHIQRSPSLHCFTCGHVAPEADFHGEGGLGCPKCRARLRHIGVDYDKPMTQYACGSCHHVFVETDVVARCLDCNHAASPGELDVREVSTLRLSSHGRAALRAGQIHESFAALDSANYVVPNYFQHMAGWALASQVRHKEMVFGLVLVEFENGTELVEAHGASRAYLMLDEFAQRLREMLRTSDITTRTSEHRLWLFLPFTPPEGLVRRLHGLFEAHQPVKGPAIQARIRSLFAPRDVDQSETIQDLMARLETAD